MIPTTESWLATPQLAGVKTVRFWLAHDCHQLTHLKRYPWNGTDEFTVLVEPTDNLSLVNLDFCEGKTVWIESEKSEARRCNLLFKRLRDALKPPRLILASTDKGLVATNPKTKGYRLFKEV